MKVLVTGGLGFIGSHLVKSLLETGHHVTILDALVTQVHGNVNPQDVYIPESGDFIYGDVRDIEVWKKGLQDCDVVYHLAAEVGVGQSMYEIVRYISANTLGTANLCELLARQEYPVRKVIVASSMSIYGEGLYNCSSCGLVSPNLRSDEQLSKRQWEVSCPHCHQIVIPLPTNESKPLNPTSVYAISKRDQEELCLNIGRAYNIPTVALRFFNTYGPGQALSNPYTGVIAIFASRLLNQKSPIVFEDGQQLRDFVHVKDVVRGLLLALSCEQANYQALNIGSGKPRSVNDVARIIAEALKVDIEPQVINQFRQGDIRHCFADISKASEILGYTPLVDFSKGVSELVDWVKHQTAVDRFDQAKQELEKRGLAK